MPHEKYMREAIRIAREKMEANEGGPFGAVLVKENRIIARGWNRVTSTNDPTAHAEIVAIRSACQVLADFKLDGCVLYVNAEPCPMCLAAAYWAGLDKIYYAATREDAAAIGFADELLYRELVRLPNERQLPMEQLLRAEALPVFALWEAKEDKILY